MLYGTLARTLLWLHWFVEYHSFVENEYGCCDTVDCEELCDWLEDFLKIHLFDYDYDQYSNI